MQNILTRWLFGALLSALTLPAIAQTPVWQWAVQSTGGVASGSNVVPQHRGQNVATDASGNVYVVGNFEGTVTFGTTTLTSAGLSDVYVGKLSPAGQWLWVVRGGGAGYDYGNAIAVDPTGNVVIGGGIGEPYCSTCPPNATFGSLAVPNGTSGALIARLSGAGQWLWANRGWYDDDMGVRGVATDAVGNVYVTGNYHHPLSSTASVGMFVAKATPQGHLQWRVKSVVTAEVYAPGIKVDARGNVYVAGIWQYVCGGGPITLGSTVMTLPANALGGMFVTKLSAAGAWQWATQAPCRGTSVMYLNLYKEAALVLDSGGNPYVAYTTDGVGQFGATACGVPGMESACVAKISTAGQWQWAKRVMPGTSTPAGSRLEGLAIDGRDNLYLAGQSDHAWTVFNFTLLPFALATHFVAKLSASGEWAWATGSGQPCRGGNVGLAADASGNLYQTGSYDYANTVVARLSPRTGAAAISSFSPANGGPGMTVTLTGTNLTGATAVAFAEVLTTRFTVNATGTQLTATVPATGSLTGPIGVLTPQGMAATASIFTFWPKPGLSSTIPFAPYSAPPGTVITITGYKFTGATGVKVGAVSMPYTVRSGTQITATVPAGAVSGKIAVTTPGGTATSTATLTVTPPGSPVITSFSPANGPVGSVVTITGTGFTGASGVRFFVNTAATFTVVSATQIRATVPYGGISGRLTVANAAGSALSLASFTIPTPSIYSFSPLSGPAGTVITLTGANLTEATTVQLGTVSVPFTVVSATQIRATVPAGATTGKLAVVTPNGQKTTSTSFTVTTMRPVAPPMLAVSPNPAHEQVYLREVPAGARVELIDGQGQIRRAVELAAGATELSLRGLPPGLYWLRCGSSSQRLVVE